MRSILARIFSTRYMVRESLIRGDIPSSKEAYMTSFGIALPSMVEMVSVSVIGIINTAMVGNLGSYAVTAVGLTAQPRMVFLSLFFAMNIGVTAIVSRRRGQNDQQAVRLCVKQALIIGIILSLLMVVLAVSTADWVMKIAGAQEDTIVPASDYFRITGVGLVFQSLSMTICAAQRGVGNTRITMITNMAANATNIILSYLLINGNLGFPRLEVKGVALAAVAGFFVGFLIAFLSLFKKGSYIRISFKDSWKLDIPMMKSIIKIGSGSMLEQVALRVGFLVYARVVADLGTDHFAAHQVANQLMGLSFNLAEGIGVATTALVGQNLGKKRPDLSVIYAKIGQRLSMMISIILATASTFGRYLFASLFSDDPVVINLAANVMLILVFVLPIQTSHIVMGGSLRGSGDIKYVAMTMLITVTIIRPIISILLIYTFGFGLEGAWFALAFDQTLRLILLYIRFSKEKWLTINV